MAKAMGAEVILLHVVIDLAMYSSIYPTTGIWQINENGVVDLYENANKSAHEFLDKAKHHLGDVSIQTLLKEGDAAQIILNISSEMKVDLWVLIARNGWKTLFMGSVTEEVLKKTN